MTNNALAIAFDATNTNDNDKRTMVLTEIRNRLNSSVAQRFDEALAKEKTATRPSRVVARLCEYFRFNMQTRVCDVSDKFIESLAVLHMSDFAFMRNDINALQKIAFKVHAVTRGRFDAFRDGSIVDGHNADKRCCALMVHMLMRDAHDVFGFSRDEVLTIFARAAQPRTEAQVSSSLTALRACNVLKRDAVGYRVNRNNALMLIAKEQFDL